MDGAPAAGGKAMMSDVKKIHPCRLLPGLPRSEGDGWSHTNSPDQKDSGST